MKNRIWLTALLLFLAGCSVGTADATEDQTEIETTLQSTRTETAENAAPETDPATSESVTEPEVPQARVPGQTVVPHRGEIESVTFRNLIGIHNAITEGLDYEKQMTAGLEHATPGRPAESLENRMEVTYMAGINIFGQSVPTYDVSIQKTTVTRTTKNRLQRLKQPFKVSRRSSRIYWSTPRTVTQRALSATGTISIRTIMRHFITIPNQVRAIHRSSARSFQIILF